MMRGFAIAGGVGFAAFVTLLTGVAGAAGPTTPSKTRTTETGAPSSSGESSQGTTTIDTSEEQHGGATVRNDLSEEGRAGRAAVTKPWEIGVEWETHRLFVQTDLQGQAADKVANFFGAYAQFDFDEYDRLGLRWGFSQRFLADEGETGLRGDDLALFYTRFVPLPERFLLRITGQVTAPTSFYSQKAGLITAPRLSVALDRRFGDFVLSARVTGDLFVSKYDSNIGGDPNPTWRLAEYLAAEYRMPFLPELAVGVDVSFETVWYHDIMAPTGSSIEGDAVFVHQPTQQIYGGEVFVRYLLPDLAGIRSDITGAFAQGDPSLGFNSYLHDGVGHVYPFFFREATEVYVAFSARY
jgi:hypothetical protein